MDKKIESAAIITAALLRNHANPSAEKIAELLTQALDAIHIADGLENKLGASHHFSGGVAPGNSRRRRR